MKPARSILPSLFPILDIKQGRENRDLGIKKAIEKADRDSKDWSKRAYEFLEKFLKTRSEPFLAEEVRAQAAVEDFDLPTNPRAWGHIFKRARIEGLIITNQTAKVKNKKAHCANSALWVKVK
jgi:hypothetical protein